MKATLFLGMKYERLILTLQEVCEEIGIVTGTAHNMLSAGTFPIPTRKEGRNRVADVRDVGAYLDKRREEAKTAHASCI
ncbi:helix-turn-helix transcriptional regulator [Collimonas pratensis]|uniref:helix-turn-helix transcriptional regulator n=1 Tax=Collimonas pratensis TaxID=279113 RepID=UPI0009EEECA0|nr:hypothetical protein [Collimonas pratensis]